MERSLSAIWQRAQLISNNIANEDTPGYKAKRLSFEGILRGKIRSAENIRSLTRAQRVDIVDATPSRVYTDPTLSVRADGNNVNLDNEHIELARAQLQYQALQQKITGHYTQLKYAISGGQ
jgi:flagellar basal-body rod protein FlgB